MPQAPKDITELYNRAQQLAGLTLGELAQQADIKVPEDLTRHKGWAGMLIEWHLGASAGSKPEQDFPHLGVELKTLPINQQGKPLETTYVCIAPLQGEVGITWEKSNVRNKLSCVLWVPILAERTIPIVDRMLANPILWRASPEQEQLLQQDWEELTDMIALGQINQITAKHGQVLQLRPKAANNKALTSAIGIDGCSIQALPRGFYLKKEFTSQVLKQLL